MAAGNGQIADPEIAGGGGAERVDADTEAEVIGVTLPQCGSAPGALQGSKPSRSPSESRLICRAITEKTTSRKSADSIRDPIDWTATLYSNPPVAAKCGRGRKGRMGGGRPIGHSLATVGHVLLGDRRATVTLAPGYSRFRESDSSGKGNGVFQN